MESEYTIERATSDAVGENQNLMRIFVAEFDPDDWSRACVMVGQTEARNAGGRGQNELHAVILNLFGRARCVGHHKNSAWSRAWHRPVVMQPALPCSIMTWAEMATVTQRDRAARDAGGGLA